MSKQDNLTDFLVDVADAIREKKGSTEKINPQNFSDEIKNLPSGSTEVEEKDVNFYDYDGTLLFSYTIPEAQALTELPTPKGHSGLIFDGWNWDYEDVIALDYPMNIGAMYRTDDGKTRLYLKVEEPTSISLSFKNNDTGTVTVDFGDGEVVETSETTPVLPHRYEVGEYVLRISGTKQLVCNYTNKDNIFGTIAGQRPILCKVEIGDNFSVQSYVFSYCMNLETITYPSKTGVYTAWSSSTFYSCVSLKWINVTKNTSSLSYQVLVKCINLRSMTVPKTFNNISNNAEYAGFTKLALPDTFSGTFVLGRSNIRRFRVPNGVINMSNAFQGCATLEEMDEPSSITTRIPQAYASCTSLAKLSLSAGAGIIQNSLFNGSVNLRDVTFKGEITSIGNSAFMSCACLGVLDFTKNTAVPTLDNINAFSYCDCQFIVPDNLYDEWIAATNWSTYADRIVKASEYQPNNE